MDQESVSSPEVLPDGEDDVKGAGVKFPPPLVFLCLLLAGIGLEYLVPASLGIPAPLHFLGLLPVIGAIVIMVITAFAFRKARTAIEPWKPTTAMVYTGCYKFTRNPIYLGFCLCLLGLGIMANSFWISVSFLPCGFIIYHVAIGREEAYLEKKFGEDYLDYRDRVRRWI